jgi:hypothetical protein
MRKFTNIKDCFQWVNKTVKETSKEAIPEIAREEYKDSEKYTYIDTGDMYNSGLNSDFENGYVVLKAPQVRWLYYTTWVKPRHNMQAIPQWHELTKRENMKKYKNIYISNFKSNKE